ncbi:MAG TPA: DUF6325 family protein [Candidatus Saccharimonadia bacterium]|nr:DUF6325 family protein [Candidatus Saccharimonadia bacterium]
MLGPIDYVAINFVGNKFEGNILAELTKAVDDGIIRVVDMIFVIKDEDGTIDAAEIEDQSEELREVFKSVGFKGNQPLLTEDDVEKIGAMMDNNTATGVLVIEQLWAKGLKKALLDANGTLLVEGRIHTDTVSAAERELEQIKA